MTQPSPLTKSQERRFYKEAVRATLVAIYGHTVPHSKEIVDLWWRRAAKTAQFDSPMFFHSEPLHVAADIAQMNAVPLTDKMDAIYRKVLEQSRQAALNPGTILHREASHLQSRMRPPAVPNSTAAKKSRAKPVHQMMTGG